MKARGILGCKWSWGKKMGLSLQGKSLREDGGKVESFQRVNNDYYQRFSMLFRLQHLLLFSSSLILISTGFPLLFSDHPLSRLFFSLVGGLQVSRVLHRIGATVLIALALFHIIYILFTHDGRMNFRALIPKARDIKDLVHNVLFFLGRRENPPRFARFNYVEKFDYWAGYWGVAVMIPTGLMLWFNNVSMALFPKYFLDLALIAHSNEALLEVLAVLMWHFYHVMYAPGRFPMRWTWLTGSMTIQEMKHEHPLEYELYLRMSQNPSPVLENSLDTVIHPVKI